jgi:hypothetical protein
MRNDIFDVAVETGKELDFHDIMYKFTLDSFILYVLGSALCAVRREPVPL